MQENKIKTQIALNKFVKFRKEKGFILMFDCEKMQHYEIPQEFGRLLSQLKQGVDIKRISTLGKDAKDLLKDLKALELTHTISI